MPNFFKSTEDSIELENLIKGREKGSCIDLKIGKIIKV